LNKKKSMAFSIEKFKNNFPKDFSGNWWVAFSGGLDSCVLLHALTHLNLPVNIRAIHINHQISPNANYWQKHCAYVCSELAISFVAIAVDVKNNGQGIEDAARVARYDAFEMCMKNNDFLFMAHHADDQAETVLLRLMRGTGPRGLSAMPANRPLGVGTLSRPLLAFTRAELEEYALTNNLKWIDDESNKQDIYDRNYLRNQVIPLLRERWPNFAKKWQQTAELCAENEKLIEILAQQDLLLSDLKSSLVGTSLNLEHVKSLSLARRHNLIRLWLRDSGLSVPEQHHLEEVERQIINGNPDSITRIDWGNVSMRTFQGCIYALPIHELPDVINDRPKLTDGIKLSKGFHLSFEKIESSNKPLLDANLPNIHVRFRLGGERCRPIGRTHSQTVKKLLQEYKVEPWMRNSLPLVYSEDNLVAVADLWVCEGFQATKGYHIHYGRLV
jgi:tRNA(Ile)-lysidine synthase